MKVILRGRCLVKDVDTENEIRSPAKLRKLNGETSGESINDYMETDGRFAFVDRSGDGELKLEFDRKSNTLFVKSSFVVFKKPNRMQLTALKNEVLGQWSDGIGSNFSERLADEFGMWVDFYPYEITGYNPSKCSIEFVDE